MRTLKFNIKQKLDIPKYDELVNVCNRALERISDLGPSDNDVRLVVNDDSDQFQASLHLSSNVLSFDTKKMARSPFMAVEGVTKEALATIQKWSVLRG